MYDTIVLLTIENILSGDIMSINKKEFNLEQVVKLCVVVNISLFLFVAFMLILFVYFNITTKTDTKDPNPLAVSIAIVAVSIISSAIAIINGPLYEINKTIISVMLACNAISVSAFLIYYTKVIVDLVIESEKKLNSIANIDLLTDLYSRRYMMRTMKAGLQWQM